MKIKGKLMFLAGIPIFGLLLSALAFYGLAHVANRRLALCHSPGGSS